MALDWIELYAGLSMYGASNSNPSLVYGFLKRSDQQLFISYRLDIFSVLESQERSIIQN